MKNYWTALSCVIGSLFISCKQKEKEPEKKYQSVVAMIRQQVADVDTTLNPIIRIVSTDSLHHDTSYIPREEFAAAAKDFLEIPDLADKKVAKRYKEELLRYDDMLGRVIFKYTPIDPANEEVKSQEFLATPVLGQDAKINNIIIVREISNKDSFLLKKMLWQIDRSFQIVTTSQQPGKPEQTTITRVIWNNKDPYQ